MATSSITKSFVISNQKQADMFVSAVEASANNRPTRVPVSLIQLTETSDIVGLMQRRKRKRANDSK